MDFLSANSGFAVQNDGTNLLRITRETCNRKSKDYKVNNYLRQRFNLGSDNFLQGSSKLILMLIYMSVQIRKKFIHYVVVPRFEKG